MFHLFVLHRVDLHAVLASSFKGSHFRIQLHLLLANCIYVPRGLGPSYARNQIPLDNRAVRSQTDNGKHFETLFARNDFSTKYHIMESF